ncbi:hypothetical protein ACPC54_26055 [Kitasatospora sp. NPDC094028]
MNPWAATDEADRAAWVLEPLKSVGPLRFGAAHGHELLRGPYGDPGADSLGVVLHAQRAGDVVLSRPVFASRDWADGCVHVPESPIPDSEWHDRPY